MKTFDKYLDGLTKKELVLIYKVKSGALKSSGCCGAEPIGTPPTPNGYWWCGTDCQWHWIPEIG